MSRRLPGQGLLIAFEGIDGAGKTTQARAIAHTLREIGLDVIESKEPTNGAWGQKLRASASTGRLPPREELDLFVKDRREHVRTLIQPALGQGQIVIVDRYYYSTAAYQGARGMDYEEIIVLNETFAPRPDLLFLLRVEPSVGRARIATRGDEANLFEGEAALAASAQIFDRIEGLHVRRLDGNQSISELQHTIVEAVWHAIDQKIPRAAADRPPITAGDLVGGAERVLADGAVRVEDKAKALLDWFYSSAARARV